MRQSFLVKSDIINELSVAVNSFESAEEFAKKEFSERNISKESIYSLFSRKNTLSELLSELNVQSNKLFMISGFQGTGKTELIKNVTELIDDHVLSFYYECSPISSIDDLILSFYQYLQGALSKDTDFFRSKKSVNASSIDRKLIEYLKNLKSSLLIVLDGFENFMPEDFSISESEVSRFINFLLSLPKIKIILSGRRMPVSGLKIAEDRTYKLKLSGLDEPDAVRIMADYNITGSQQVLYQAYEVTRGYPESIFLLIAAVNILKISVFEVLKDYSSKNEGFEEYIVKKIHGMLPQALKNLLWFFLIIRHPVKSCVPEKLELSQNLDKGLKYLNSASLLTVNNGLYYVKDSYKEILYKLIPPAEKVKLHQNLCELYTEQISNKLSERLFPISRKSLNTEQYYHYLNLSKYKKDFNSVGQISPYAIGMPYVSASANLPPALAELVSSNENDSNDAKAQKEPSHRPITSSIVSEVLGYDDSIRIELSEEEKSLLSVEQEENQEQKQEDRQEKPEIKPPEKPAQKGKEDLQKKYIENAIMARKKGNSELALSYFNKALDLAKESCDNRSIASINKSIGNILMTLNNHEGALDCYKSAIEYYLIVEDQQNSVFILLKMSEIYTASSLHDQALGCLEKILQLHPDGNMPDKLAVAVYSRIGDIYDYRGELDQALKCYTSSLEKALSIDDRENISKLYYKTAVIYDDMDDVEKAMEYYKENIEIASQLEGSPHLASCYANLAALYEDAKDTNNAIIHYQKALETCKKTGDLEGQCRTLSRLGSIYFDLEVKDKALGYFLDEIQAAKQTGDSYSVAMSYLDAGDFYLSEKQYENALKSFIIARKNVGNTISTDSKDKIERRFKHVMTEVGEVKFNIMIENIRRKYGQ